MSDGKGQGYRGRGKTLLLAVDVASKAYDVQGRATGRKAELQGWKGGHERCAEHQAATGNGSGDRSRSAVGCKLLVILRGLLMRTGSSDSWSGRRRDRSSVRAGRGPPVLLPCRGRCSELDSGILYM